MKKILGLMIAVMILVIGLVSATTTTLSNPSITMGYNDESTVQFCNVGSDTAVDVLVSPICRDVDGIFGCQAGDEFSPSGFNVVSNTSTLAVGDCATLTLTTTLAPDEGGVFYYTANGQVGDTTVGSETGKVYVPEMGVAGAALVLLGAGLFIAKKGKKQ